MSGLKCISCYYRFNLPRRGVLFKFSIDYRNLYNDLRQHNLVKHNLQFYRAKHGHNSSDGRNTLSEFSNPGKSLPDISKGPGLKEFVKSDNSAPCQKVENIPYLKPNFGNDRKGRMISHFITSINNDCVFCFVCF